MSTGATHVALCTFENELYTVGYATGNLYRWNGYGPIWQLAATVYGGYTKQAYLEVFEGELYCAGYANPSGSLQTIRQHFRI